MKNEIFAPQKRSDDASLDLDNPISDVLSQLGSKADKFEYDRSRGRAVGQFIREDGIVRVEVQDFTGSRDATFSFTPNNLSKVDLETTVIERLKNGETQSDVAYSVGKSQSWVSNIKRKYGL